jgi:hypothetical protein
MTDRKGIFFQKKLKNYYIERNQSGKKLHCGCLVSCSKKKGFIWALDWPLAELAALLPKGTSFGRSDISSSVASPLMIARNDGVGQFADWNSKRLFTAYVYYKKLCCLLYVMNYLIFSL